MLREHRIPAKEFYFACFCNAERHGVGKTCQIVSLSQVYTLKRIDFPCMCKGDMDGQSWQMCIKIFSWKALILQAGSRICLVNLEVKAYNERKLSKPVCNVGCCQKTKRGGSLMKINHIALYTNHLEEMKSFYVNYFKGKASAKYVNETKGFSSYFISFDSGARLEIMEQKGMADQRSSGIGFVHLAFSVGTREAVDQLTALLVEEEFQKVSAPRVTGDGYYESSVLDPDGNLIEITE